MAMNILGETIDIHCGGIDNMFPHHENEIAQSECASGKTFVNLWMHSEHLIVDNKKMSKSLGNFYTLRDLMEKGYTGNEVRYMLLHTHYKTQLNFTFQGLDSVRSSLSRLRDFIIRLRECEGEETGSLNGLIEKSLSCFKASLGDDLNISEALACLFEFVRETNGLIDQKKVGAKDAEKALSFLEHLNTVLNILPLKTQEKIPPHLISLLEERKKARDEKNWALADKIRIEFQSHGYVVEDTAQGARLKKC
jgi:cysteinyl-tRNA synthetase